MIDEQIFTFQLSPVVPELTSISPVLAIEGQLVTLRGDRFGAFPYRNAVLFTATGGGAPSVVATEVVSWSETEIQVRVPSGAGTGPVLVRRGEVNSNPVDFTLDRRTSLQGTVARTLPMGAGSIAHFDGSWALMGAGAVLESRSSYDRHIFGFNPEMPVEFSLNFTADYVPREWKTGGGEIWRVVSVVLVVESDLRRASGSTAAVSESGSGGQRNDVISNARRGDSFAVMVNYRTFIDRFDDKGNLLLAGWELTSASMSATFIIEAR